MLHQLQLLNQSYVYFLTIMYIVWTIAAQL